MDEYHRFFFIGVLFVTFASVFAENDKPLSEPSTQMSSTTSGDQPPRDRNIFREAFNALHPSKDEVTNPDFTMRERLQTTFDPTGSNSRLSEENHGQNSNKAEPQRLNIFRMAFEALRADGPYDQPLGTDSEEESDSDESE